MRRIFAISDTHIGGSSGTPMLGHPEHLIEFLKKLAALPCTEATTKELVIHGDFIDFLAETPYAGWTPTQQAALDKINRVFASNCALFDALASCAQRLDFLTIMLGNHDIETTYPSVKDALFARLNVSRKNCVALVNNEPFTAGELLIEHGNRYDSWNAIDYSTLRQITSAVARGEEPLKQLPVCPGSRLVAEVMNPLKERYHFLDLLKPETKLVPLIVKCLEPSLSFDLGLIYHGAQLYAKQWLRTRSWYLLRRQELPGSIHLAGGSAANPLANLPEDVMNAFAEDLDAYYNSDRPAGATSNLIKKFLNKRPDSLKYQLLNDIPIAQERLRKLQLLLRTYINQERTFELDEPDGPYAQAARRIISTGHAKVVVMGHSHIAKLVPVGSGFYVNTGAWCDLMKIPANCLEPTDHGLAKFQVWLRLIASDQISDLRYSDPHYADITLNTNGKIINAQPLRNFLTEGIIP